MNLENLIKTKRFIDNQEIEIAKLKENLIDSCQEYRAFFEATWDDDPDLTADRERDAYRKCIKHLIELGGSISKHYLIKINEHENELPY